MTEFMNLLTEAADGILTITVNRPESMNALNNQTINELKMAVQNALDDKEIKGIIITGSGDKAFVAGADIKEIAGLDELTARKFSENGQEAFNLIAASDKPVIAAINGYALGGGCEVAIACHLRIAVENAKFGQPEVNLGLIPGYGGTQRLTQLIGRGRALELMITGDMISAQDAKAFGLVNHVVASKDELHELSHKLMKKIISKAPLAVGMVINCVNAYYGKQNGYQTEANAFMHCTKTRDFKEGTQAFIEKRKPQFKGE